MKKYTFTNLNNALDFAESIGIDVHTFETTGNIRNNAGVVTTLGQKIGFDIEGFSEVVPTSGGTHAHLNKRATHINTIARTFKPYQIMRITIIHTAYVDRDYNIVPATIEVSVTAGIGIHLVGLRDDAVPETLLRVVTALHSCGYHIPGRKIVINVTPAIRDIKDNSAYLDLPIAVGILQASEQINVGENNEIYVAGGELALDGTIRHPLYNLTDAVHHLEQRSNTK